MQPDKNRSDEFVEAFINPDVKRQELPLRQEAKRLQNLKYENHLCFFGTIGSILGGVVAYIAGFSLFDYIFYGFFFGYMLAKLLGILYKILCRFYKRAKA
jgi:hypothetical protein